MISDSFHSMQQRDWIALFAVSAVVAICGVFGVSYVAGQGWALLPLPIAGVLIVACTFITAILLFFIDVGLWCVRVRNRQIDRPVIGPFKPSRFAYITPQWKKSSILIFGAVMAFFWLPWFVANFPGGTYWDTYYQIYQVYPENHPIAIIPWQEIYDQTLTDAWLVDHHPIFTTLVYGAFGWTSDQLTGNWMAGVALFCIIQGVAHIVAFTAAVAYLRRVGCPLPLCFAAYVFFCIMPFVSTWALCMVKDSFFGLFYIPYFMMLFEAVRTCGRVFRRTRNIVLLCLCALMLCLTKKTGLFVVVPTAFVGAWLCAKGRPTVAFVSQGLFSVIVVGILFPMLLFPALNVVPGGKQEVLGPLFQQTARYLVDHPDEVTVEESSAIAAVIDYALIDDSYVFDFQDSVKYRFNLDATDADLMRYLKVYVQMGFKHPESYFAALMSLAGFYVAPTAYANIRMVTVDTKMGPDQRYMLWNPDELDWLRIGLDEAYTALGETPVLDIPVLIVTYAFWLPALVIYVMVRRRIPMGVLLTPTLVLLGFCIIAPVYDARYVVPIFNAAPLLLCALYTLPVRSARQRRQHIRSRGGTSDQRFIMVK